MSVLITIFIIVATVFAIASLAYVGIDVFLEIMEIRLAERKAREAAAPVPEPVIEPEPEPEPEPEIVEEAPVLPTGSIKYEEGAGVGKLGIINLGIIDGAFSAEETVTLAELKKRGLVRKNVGRIKILADGVLNKALTFKAEDYSAQAIEMIELMGGTVVILKEGAQ